MDCTTLKITCPEEPDMENTFIKEYIEQDIREMLGREPEENEWIEWVMFHDDVDDYFADWLVNIVSMPSFINGIFELKGVKFTFEKM